MNDTQTTFVLTEQSAVMPCCGADGNQPGNIKVFGWALMPERIDCKCGVEWDIVCGAEFDHCDPDNTVIQRRVRPAP